MSRLIPKEGLTIASINYKDVEEYSGHKEFIEEIKSDSDHLQLHEVSKELSSRFGMIKRMFIVYGFYKGELIGCAFYHEFIGNTDGYGEGDFMITKLIAKPFRGRKPARYFTTNLAHVLLKSGIAKRIYGYIPVFVDDPDPLNLWKRGENTVCFTKMTLKDGPHKQNFFKVIKVIPTSVCDVILFEMDGELYKKIDIEKHFDGAEWHGDNAPKSKVRWLKELEDATSKVKGIRDEND